MRWIYAPLIQIAISDTRASTINDKTTVVITFGPAFPRLRTPTPRPSAAMDTTVSSVATKLKGASAN